MALPTLIEIVYVAIGGALGSVCRYGIQHLSFLDNCKYYYTAVANLSGCILIGIVWALLNHYNIGRGWYLFLITGVLGGYTTFSAFSLDAMQLISNGMVGRALGYVALTVIGGLIGCAIGIYITQRLLR
jgi:CrcB protein